jgi:A/G-specific adenine glycosylase
MVLAPRGSLRCGLMAQPHSRIIRRRILDWFAREQRDLPWRHTREPWAVLVSEVMLQQTQASRITERFPAFLARFPTPAAMTAAPDADVLAAWSGLGYNRRALALRRAAEAVAAGGWPRDLTGLRALPGVGPYTARAVAAIAFGQPVGAVDTNVRRWLIRRFDLPDDAPSATLQALADALAAAGPRDPSGVDAARWMHASMEFGARVCAARQPRCDACPIARGCPSRGRERHVPVLRQAPFAGSLRATRGAMLRALAAAPDRALPAATLAATAPAGDIALAALERDGLAHRRGGMIRLGGPDQTAMPSTIER